MGPRASSTLKEDDDDDEGREENFPDIERENENSGSIDRKSIFP